MKVHNINGTSDNKCKCGSWEAHWEKFNERKRSWPKYCSESSCTESATVGAHVQKDAGKQDRTKDRDGLFQDHIAFFQK